MSAHKYLTHWDRCAISMRQGVILLAHLGAPQPFRRGASVSSLIKRRWLQPEEHGRITSLTERGRKAARRAAAAIDDRLSPPLAPQGFYPDDDAMHASLSRSGHVALRPEADGESDFLHGLADTSVQSFPAVRRLSPIACVSLRATKPAGDGPAPQPLSPAGGNLQTRVPT